MRRTIGKIINAVTNPLGYAVVRKMGAQSVDRKQYVDSILEVEALCRQNLFQAIPENKSRQPLLAHLLGTHIV